MINENPLVSIITICLNSAKTIRRAIESVLAQTYDNWEYIIIDGLSTDDTVKIIEAYQNNLSHFVSEKDKGISDAFNKGISLSKGEYIQLLNADDFLPPDKIDISISTLLQYPNYDFVFGDVTLVDGDNNPKMRIIGDPNYKSTINYFMPRILHQSCLVKKKVYDNVGFFDLKWKIAMDYEWFLRVHKYGYKGIYNKNIYTYMQDGGISIQNPSKAMKEDCQISKQFGLSPFVANLLYYFRTTKYKMRGFLEKYIPIKLIIFFRPGRKSIQ